MRSAIGLALALVFVLIGAAPASAQGTLDQLLARFAAVEGMECRFREERRDPLLLAPIVSDGTVHYARPGRIVRRITRPIPEIVLIDAGRVQISRRGRIETIASDPNVRSLIDTFSLLFAGERSALERLYRVGYTSGEQGWTISLTPRTTPLDRLLREIRFEGESTTLRTMVMNYVDGTIVTTRFEGVDTARRFTPEESARIFSLR